jgi:hypothetical protein
MHVAVFLIRTSCLCFQGTKCFPPFFLSLFLLSAWVNFFPEGIIVGTIVGGTHKQAKKSDGQNLKYDKYKKILKDFFLKLPFRKTGMDGLLYYVIVSCFLLISH